MLPLISLNTFTPLFMGTVRGFDELIPEKLSVVYEKRLYEQNPWHVVSKE